MRISLFRVAKRCRRSKFASALKSIHYSFGQRVVINRSYPKTRTSRLPSFARPHQLAPPARRLAQSITPRSSRRILWLQILLHGSREASATTTLSNSIFVATSRMAFNSGRTTRTAKKPRQRLGVEYKRLGQHPCLCLLPGKPLARLWPCGDQCSPPCCLHAIYELPIGHGHTLLSSTPTLINHAVTGWSLSTIATIQTGFPFSPQLGYNPTGSGDTRNPVRPNLTPNFTGSLYSRGSTATGVA